MWLEGAEGKGKVRKKVGSVRIESWRGININSRGGPRRWGGKRGK